MKTITLQVEGMSCGGCIKSVERILQKQPGVTRIDEVELGKAVITHDADIQQLDEILSALERAQFHATLSA